MPRTCDARRWPLRRRRVMSEQRHFLRAERERVIIVQRRLHAEPLRGFVTLSWPTSWAMRIATML